MPAADRNSEGAFSEPWMRQHSGSPQFHKSSSDEHDTPESLHESPCQIIPPCRQGNHGAHLSSEGGMQATKAMGKYHFTEPALKHDLNALQKGKVYSADEFYTRAKAWYKAEIDRLLHREKVKQEARDAEIEAPRLSPFELVVEELLDEEPQDPEPKEKASEDERVAEELLYEELKDPEQKDKPHEEKRAIIEDVGVETKTETQFVLVSEIGKERNTPPGITKEEQEAKAKTKEEEGEAKEKRKEVENKTQQDERAGKEETKQEAKKEEEQHEEKKITAESQHSTGSKQKETVPQPKEETKSKTTAKSRPKKSKAAPEPRRVQPPRAAKRKAAEPPPDPPPKPPTRQKITTTKKASPAPPSFPSIIAMATTAEPVPESPAETQASKAIVVEFSPEPPLDPATKPEASMPLPDLSSTYTVPGDTGTTPPASLLGTTAAEPLPGPVRVSQAGANTPSPQGSIYSPLFTPEATPPPPPPTIPPPPPTPSGAMGSGSGSRSPSSLPTTAQLPGETRGDYVLAAYDWGQFLNHNAGEHHKPTKPWSYVELQGLDVAYFVMRVEKAVAVMVADIIYRQADKEEVDVDTEKGEVWSSGIPGISVPAPAATPATPPQRSKKVVTTRKFRCALPGGTERSGDEDKFEPAAALSPGEDLRPPRSGDQTALSGSSSGNGNLKKTYIWTGGAEKSRPSPAPNAEMETSPTLGRWPPYASEGRTLPLEYLSDHIVEISGLKFAVDLCASFDDVGKLRFFML
ncbi:hypothetical protein B0H63DRAFT_546669 [Podospora didyma]|uniref:Uncharacterized protein n=1 Tax=Podospora didyma TaxID=330526 RepID=A0AAE0NI49_9PEZI|nr:hypothetical protein B0H63DRAFT_546669 [Podospora didyma]